MGDMSSKAYDGHYNVCPKKTAETVNERSKIAKHTAGPYCEHWDSGKAINQSAPDVKRPQALEMKQAELKLDSGNSMYSMSGPAH